MMFDVSLLLVLLRAFCFHVICAGIPNPVLLPGAIIPVTLCSIVAL